MKKNMTYFVKLFEIKLIKELINMLKLINKKVFRHLKIKRTKLTKLLKL